MRILPVFIPHSGCRHDCVFCDQRRVSLVADPPEPEQIAALIEQGRQHGKLDEVAFYGGSFTALPLPSQRAYLQAVQPFLADGSVGAIRLSTRPDAVDESIVAMLLDSGVSTVELGCQSFSDPVLQAAGRGHSARDNIEAAQLLRANGFRLGLQLMPGLPLADRGEALFSLNEALNLAPDFLRVYPTLVVAGTELAKRWQRSDYRPLDLDEAVELCADIETACRQRQVPVIRYGLQANDALDSDAVVAGPYHPAFGQLVRSQLWRRVLLRVLQQGGEMVQVHPADLSNALGHRRSNLQLLCGETGKFSISGSHEVARGNLFINNRSFRMESLVGNGAMAE